MEKVIQGVVTSHFGGRLDPIGGAYRVHQGIDISAIVGTSIYSPTEGVISAVYTHLQGGITLIVRSKCGTVRYGLCHLSDVVLEPGTEVAKGDLIALSGNTGRSTGAHLHFSVKTGGKWYAEQYVGGKYVDSEPYLIISGEQN